MEKVHVSKSVIEAEIAKGVSKEDIRKNLYPALNQAQWKKVLKACGLNTKRVPKVDFVIDDMEEMQDTVTPEGNTYAPSISVLDESVNSAE